MVATRSRGLEFHEFFKVYFPDHSSKHLRLPPAFVKHFRGTIPRNVKLVDVSGNSWHVEVQEAESSVFFMNGWEKFASDHSLRLGNFLVFRYTGSSVYDVTIFRNNGCVNEESLANQCMVEDTSALQKCAKIKEEPEEDCSQRNCRVHLQRSGKAKARGSSEVTQQKSRRIGPMTSGQCKTFGVHEFTIPTNPHFIASVCPGTLHQLNIPRRLLNEIKTKMEPEMVLRVRGGNGNRWRVGVLFCKDGKTIFSRGWAQFRRDNKIKLYDQCMFEFVYRGGTRPCYEVQVQILRANSGKLPPKKTSLTEL